GHHAILKDGVVVVEGDRVLHVGPSFDGPVDRTLDAQGKLVSPGFINIHGVANIDIQTLTLDAKRDGLMTTPAYALHGKGDYELLGQRLKTSALFSLVQFLKGGATTIVEITTMAPSRFEVPRDEAPTLAETAGELGARIYVSHKFRAGKRYLKPDGVMDYHWDEEAARAALQYGIEVCQKYEGAYNDRIRTMLFPYQYDACSKDLLMEVKRAARELGVPVHMHTSQSLFEFHDSLRRYGKTPVQLLDSIGFLDERTIITHLIFTTLHPASGFPKDNDSDLRLVAASGATVAHDPLVYARSGKALRSFARYRQAGINVAIGTDTWPQDMITEMRWAALGCKWTDRDANRGSAREVFNAATLGGAKALGRDDLGRLTPGAKADLLIVDFTRLHIGPVDDPIKTLVYASKGTDIETVMVDGKIVVQNGQVAGVDEAKLIAQATEAHLWQKGRFTAEHPSGAPMEELFPPTYPVK
ncbi:MAG: amidohydrolase family protein, partial [Chloroflexi bacterium]|nr:amidohydrolase family protein [Chloroflexota bacterium]